MIFYHEGSGFLSGQLRMEVNYEVRKNIHKKPRRRVRLEVISCLIAVVSLVMQLADFVFNRLHR